MRLVLVLLLFLGACTMPTDEDLSSSSTELSATTPLPQTLLCGNRPCWFGIVPGETTFEEAANIVQDRYGADYLSGDSLDWQTKSLIGTIQIDARDIVSAIRIGFSTRAVQVHDLADRIGEPDQVLVTRAFSSDYLCAGLMLSYLEQHLIVSLHPDNDSVGVTQRQRVSALELRSKPLGYITDTWFIDWQGYTDYCNVAGELPASS